MEQHEGLYEQIIDVNNGNQGAEFISQQLVEEIVQNDNNQNSTINCEISEMEIIMSNDCTSVPDQCNSNVVITFNAAIESEKQIESTILKDEPTKTGDILELNNIGENSSICNVDLKEFQDNAENFILQSEISFQEEKFEVSSSVVAVTSSERSDKKTITETSESVSAVNVNESFPVSTYDQSNDNSTTPNNSQNNTENSNEEHLQQRLENELLNDENDSESFDNNIQGDNIETMEIEVKENVVIGMEESQNKSDSQCINVKQEKQVMIVSSSNVGSHVKNGDSNSKISAEVIAETDTDVKILTNSDDVAVLTEFNSIEYNTQEDDEVKEDNFNQSKVIGENSDESAEMVKNISAAKEQENDSTDNSTESTENNASAEQNKEESKNDMSMYDELENDDEEDELDLHLSAQSTESHRKVIQDIFDDWQDENVEEENNESSASLKEHQDSVEMELQNLLNDDVQQEQIISSTSTNEHSVNSSKGDKNADRSAENASERATIISEKVSSPSTKKALDSKNPSNKKPIPNYIPAKDRSASHSPKNPIQDQSDFKHKLQSPRPGVKVPGLHLTSQIASTAEVNEVLKERLREKQKDFQTPKTADIVFVKKITQRLSSQLSAASAVPPLIPLPSMLSTDHENEKNKSIEEISVEINKTSSATDSKELLAILEGDVDPDWSNLKSTTEENNKIPTPGESHSTGSKLDPVIERELALKQLLELPNISTKKNSPVIQKKNKKSAKSTPGKTSPDQTESKSIDGDGDVSKMEVINVDSSMEEATPRKGRPPKALKENNDQNSRGSAVTPTIEIGIEESRSGRKRKLTEKAREHELTVKRQKVFKGKVAVEKKSSQEPEETSKQKPEIISSTPIKVSGSKEEAKDSSTLSTSTTKSSQTKVETKTNKPETRTSLPKTETKQQNVVKSTEAKSVGIKGKMISVKRTKLGLIKKDVPIAKRKLAVKNLLRQKVGRKASAAMKTKAQAADSPSKTSIPEKATSAAPASKAKKVTEIDRLLQDEGVVNLLYDVEQPDSRKRLVPITKTQKKVMDVEKAQKELKLRKKMVKNAVMRLRNASAPTDKISPRSRRNVVNPDQSSPQNEKKATEPTKSLKSPPMPVPTEFIIPAKIRNAAEASRIIRRHSSSSFSSASASPRVSIDVPPESIKIEEPEVQTKSKRKLSQDTNDKVDVKKGKKKVAAKAEAEAKDTHEKSPVKKEAAKKITTRSNVVTPTSTVAMNSKTVSKNKKVPKGKISLDSSSNDAKSPSKGQDELSACLAEAASALLSSISGSSRSSNASNNRKKGSTNNSKTTDDEKVDTKKLFSNKEINVRQHGHLVQLILTPSAPVSGIRNAMTIQVMNEIREALSILKNDDDCRVVLFTSTGTSFCEGLELSSLLHSNKEERKSRAEEMANTVKEFIKTLATFNKPIVAGVQGAAIGLGVTMLPLFDLVIASDKATFSTPYGKLGHIAEGTAVLTLSHSVGSAVTNELLLGGRVLTASEALRAGLVTRVLWPDRFQGELLPLLKAMSEQSSQSMQATKALLRHSLCEKLDMPLESESSLLVQHWCSMECQEAIKAYIDENGQ